MPELPEVERGRRLAERTLVGRTLVRVRCVQDRIVFEGAAPSTFQRKLRGRRVEAVRRWGKQLWFELDAPPHPLFHFGMTGAFAVPREAALPLATGPKVQADGPWPPRFTKIHFWTDSGAELVMTNARRLGRIKLRHDPMAESPIADLGFDPLLALPNRGRFETLVRARRGAIKNLLMDQTFSAGVGNWIADEVLYQAGIDPRRPANQLDTDQIAALRATLGAVVRRAVAVDAVKRRFPSNWLFHHRWGKKASAVTAAGEPIEFLTIGGRTTAWVPSRQR